MSTLTSAPTGDKVLSITRILNAPRDLVFRAFTQASHLRRWWGPAGFDITVIGFKLCPGGGFYYSMQAPIGHPLGDGYIWGKFLYQEIVPPERLVLLNAFTDERGNAARHPMIPSWPAQVLNSLTFTEQDGGTVVLLESTPEGATAEEHDTFVSNCASTQGGFGGSFTQLETYLGKLRPYSWST